MILVRGTPASKGMAQGRLQILRATEPASPYSASTPDEERHRLDTAMVRADEQLAALRRGQQGEAADIMEFQRGLLEDDDLIGLVRQRIEKGDGAPDAWAQTIDREAAEYRDSGDDQLGARADDLTDLRDRVLRNLTATPAAAADNGTEDVLLAAEALAPSRFLELDLRRIRGIVTARGSANSHVAILARARGVPMVVGCGDGLLAIGDGRHLLLDAHSGTLSEGLAEPGISGNSGRTAYAWAPGSRHTVTADGQAVRICVNLDHPSDLTDLDAAAIDGVGLVRTEFLLGDSVPGEDEQVAAYRRILDWADGRPVTIRLFDAGGDKPVKGLTMGAEANPFLGLRGIRLMQHRPAVFAEQMRALARAAVFGQLRVMAPMVSIPQEMTEVRSLMLAQVAELERRGVACRLPSLGMMVEVPSAAILAADFDADFYSIGTNDLVQYTLAAARDDHRLAYLSSGTNLAVLSLIGGVVDVGRDRDRSVGICGDMASDPGMVAALLGAGLRELSVAPGAVAAVKQAVAQWNGKEPQP